jgi:hypothetical protein
MDLGISRRCAVAAMLAVARSFTNIAFNAAPTMNLKVTHGLL